MAAGWLLRAFHLLAMSVIVGGALLLAARGTDARTARRYEYLFWGAAALAVATGVGNLGAFGDAPPALATAWGGRLQAKLLALLVLLVLSLARTLTCLRAPDDPRLRMLHAATAVLAILVAALGVSLAHG